MYHEYIWRIILYTKTLFKNLTIRIRNSKRKKEKVKTRHSKIEIAQMVTYCGTVRIPNHYAICVLASKQDVRFNFVILLRSFQGSAMTLTVFYIE